MHKRLKNNVTNNQGDKSRGLNQISLSLKKDIQTFMMIFNARGEKIMLNLDETSIIKN